MSDLREEKEQFNVIGNRKPQKRINSFTWRLILILLAVSPFLYFLSLGIPIESKMNGNAKPVTELERKVQMYQDSIKNAYHKKQDSLKESLRKKHDKQKK